MLYTNYRGNYRNILTFYRLHYTFIICKYVTFIIYIIQTFFSPIISNVKLLPASDQGSRETAGVGAIGEFDGVARRTED